MAKLINGDGNAAVYASEDADLIASLAGNVTGIAQIGNEFAYELADANTIEVKDGVIITKEGRRVQLDANAVDLFDIPNGTQGTTSYYIIGYKLETDAESKQTAATFVQIMDNGTDTIPEGTFRGGDEDIYISLYRVTQTGLSITDVDLMLPSLGSISDVKSALTEIEGKVGNGMKCAKFGVLDVTSGSAVSVDISSLDLSSEEDYMIILDGAGGYRNSTDSTMNAYIVTKTSTSFSVQGTSGGDQPRKVSYQVITFK